MKYAYLDTNQNAKELAHSEAQASTKEKCKRAQGQASPWSFSKKLFNFWVWSAKIKGSKSPKIWFKSILRESNSLRRSNLDGSWRIHRELVDIGFEKDLKISERWNPYWGWVARPLEEAAPPLWRSLPPYKSVVCVAPKVARSSRSSKQRRWRDLISEKF